MIKPLLLLKYFALLKDMDDSLPTVYFISVLNKDSFSFIPNLKSPLRFDKLCKILSKSFSIILDPGIR